jgi:hypothetical protein
MRSFSSARAAAYAEFDLARVRQAKIAADRAHARVRRSRAPQLLVASSVTKAVQHLNALPRGIVPPEILPIDHAATMPSEGPDRPDEAIRRALPELLRLDRYERRANALRDQAIRDITKGRMKSV